MDSRQTLTICQGRFNALGYGWLPRVAEIARTWIERVPADRPARVALAVMFVGVAPLVEESCSAASSCALEREWGAGGPSPLAPILNHCASLPSPAGRSAGRGFSGGGCGRLSRPCADPTLF
jgi:hypothetical protein